MTVHRELFSDQVQDIDSLSNYLNRRRRAICGPRTMEQAYTDFRMQVMNKSFEMQDQQRQIIHKLDPRKVDWATAYTWWKSPEGQAS